MKVLGVIGARLNSSRLPRKHLLDLAGEPMIARIFQRLEQIPEIDQLVLATTADDYNRPLLAWAREAGKSAFAFAGDVNDLVGRVDEVVRAGQPDLVVYFCGDSPLIEPRTVSRLIRAAADHPEADLVDLACDSLGRRAIHEGFNIYPISTWRRLVATSLSAHQREHVGSALARQRDELNTRFIDDEAVFYRQDHRLSVDTPSDYRFMARLYRRWYRHHGQESIVSLPWVIEQLEKDAALRAINTSVKQKGVTERSVKTLVVTQCGSRIGLGHVGRMFALTQALQDEMAAGVEWLIQGDAFEHEALSLVPHRFIAAEADLLIALEQRLAAGGVEAVVFDLAPAHLPAQLGRGLEQMRRDGLVTVAVDGLIDLADQLDAIHIPSFYLPSRFQPLARSGKLGYGWDHYLISRDLLPQSPRPAGRRLVVLTGGSDVAALGRLWPALLMRALPADVTITWIRGPFAPPPDLPSPRPAAPNRWRVLHAPDHLAEVMAGADFALTLYGVTLFELLQLGIPTVTWTPDRRLAAEMAALAGQEVAQVADSAEAAVAQLATLVEDPARAAWLASRARGKLTPGRGARLLAQRIVSLVEAES